MTGFVTAPNAPEASPAPRRRRRGLRALVIVVVVLVILAIVAEYAARTYAQNRAEKQIEQNLPSGTTGQVKVKIHGFSVILQALKGDLDDVTLSSSDLVASGVPITFSADINDVPISGSGSTGAVDADVTIDQAALNKSAVLAGVTGSVALGTGTFSYDSSIDVIGLKLAYKVVVKPSLTDGGKQLELTPQKASITTSNNSIDVSTLLNYLKTDPPKVCVAQSLPKGSTVTALHVTKTAVTFRLHNTGLPLSSAGLSTKGSC